jgi:hypothetical protein
MLIMCSIHVCASIFPIDTYFPRFYSSVRKLLPVEPFQQCLLITYAFGFPTCCPLSVAKYLLEEVVITCPNRNEDGICKCLVPGICFQLQRSMQTPVPT